LILLRILRPATEDWQSQGEQKKPTGDPHPEAIGSGRIFGIAALWAGEQVHQIAWVVDRHCITKIS